jgi:uncharacterized lipoprotein YddW (UPF0748 family)
MQRRELLAAGGAMATLAGIAGCAAIDGAEPARLRDDEMPPPAPREWRAAWVASVAHIDWPSRPGLTVAQQQAEALALLDRARAIGLNAIVLQVRPAGDALYVSTLEPWSEYLTGEQGRAPEPAWDPLAFWIEQAHRRGLELHAWFNPYRARHPSAKTPLVAPHLALAQPAAVKTYGDMQWMDPAEPAAAERTLAVVADVVRRYDIDGVHIDDYFYPYPISQNGVEVPFPDEPAWQRYTAAGGTLARADWRRGRVDQLVEAMHRTVHAIKPHVRFGISPFGLGRPDRRPPGISGFSQYDKLYADVERWLAQGWLDYLVPQLYWPIDRTAQAFPVLLDYWLAPGQNPLGRHVWPGLFTSMVGAPQRPWPAQEIVDQVALTRTRPAATGHAHFSLIALAQDREGLATQLAHGAYALPALVPPTPWLETTPPAAPALRRRWRGDLHIVPAEGGPDAFLHAVWRRIGGRWHFALQPAHDRLVVVDDTTEAVVASAVDRLGNESPRTALRLR